MEFKANLIRQIIDAEWRLFQQVQGQGGWAACQQDRRTFDVMRHGQALSWSVETLESYLTDLETAQVAGRNLIAEKYARMMGSTAPAEYADIAPLLPPLAPKKLALIDTIVAMVIGWEQTLAADYPQIFKRGRPIMSSADRPGITSLETYLRGELATYSLNTLNHYHAHIQRQVADGINGARITLEYMVFRSGYVSLAEAEQALEASSGKDGAAGNVNDS